MDVQPDSISQVKKLRKDIFWTRCVLGLALLCLATLTVANWRRHPQTVEANEFLLRGHSGNVAARLGQNGFGDTCANPVRIRPQKMELTLGCQSSGRRVLSNRGAADNKSGQGNS